MINVISQLVVLGLNSFEVVAESLVVANLLFKLLDVSFLALAECSLENDVNATVPKVDTYEIHTWAARF